MGRVMADAAPLTKDCWNHSGVWGREQPRCEHLEQVVHCRNCALYAESSRHLLERPAAQQYMDEWCSLLAEQKQQQQRKAISILVFRLGEEWLALRTQLFQEVVDMRAVHSIPHSKSRVLLGLANVRGELHLAISVAAILGVSEPLNLESLNLAPLNENRAQTGFRRMVVIADEQDRYVFPVDEIEGVVRHAANELGRPPATGTRCSEHYLSGVLNWQERQIGCIDEQRLFTAIQRAVI
ncbi:MAG: chemotaxis protein CheW [Gammaproteobacteria bacterium]|nr:chemotaxis protein CheW [Gammaproteobacteria bacterium]